VTKAEKDLLRNQARDMKLAFTYVFGEENPANRTVMLELSRFCRGKGSTFHPDARVHALLEGRREVFLRIKDFVDLTVDELVEKYTGGNNGIPQ